MATADNSIRTQNNFMRTINCVPAAIGMAILCVRCGNKFGR